MKDLIERLEAATGPDQELDHAIGMAVGFGGDFTSSIDAALTLVPEGAEKSLSDLYGEARAEVGLNFHDGSLTGEHKGGSLAIALCIAALRAHWQPLPAPSALSNKG